MTEKRKPGRPRKAPQYAGNLTFRTTPDLRSRLTEEAAISGRSLADEVRARLERSFVINDIREAIREELNSAPAPAEPRFRYWSGGVGQNTC